MKKILVLGIVVASSLFAYPSLTTKQCLTCHGEKFEKKAMGFSRQVSGMSSKDVATALKGYKKKSYGGSMKMIMERQVDKYSDKELEDLSLTIGK